VLTCTFFKDQEGHVRGFEISGHASGAAKGENLICASVSFLARTGVLALKDLLGLTLLVRQEKSGYLRCMLSELPQTDVLEKSDFLFQVIENGLLSLGQQSIEIKSSIMKEEK